ncbi:MAG: GNAT family N-acetyltransferase [Acidimicrobiales bacterium]|jgi:RimJ/RimL family protein N-acetyltransferase|nr:GNAT family N-acetyltransferase [Acidimicrobiales bacterium]
MRRTRKPEVPSREIWEQTHTLVTDSFTIAPLPLDPAAFEATIDDEVIRAQGWPDPRAAASRMKATSTRTPKQPAPEASCPTMLGVYRPDGELVGVYILTLGPPKTGSSLGYWFGPTGRGKGLATATLPLIIDYGHNHLGTSRVRIHTAVNNTANRRVVERAGATYRGSAPHRLPEGSKIDSVWYSFERANDTTGPTLWPPPC